MKPAPFSHHAPKTVEEAVAILAQVAPEDGRVLAGGQSLVPAMAFRVARPAHLVDINDVAGLDRLAVENEKLAIGACVRHAAFHRPVTDGPLGALLMTVVHNIAHYPIRMRGTFCGSIAHADPASEWCLVAATLGAEMTAQSVRGKRAIAADDFFEGLMSTALAEDELLVETRLPILSADTRFGFYEFSRRAGDYAIAMALATFRLEGGVIVEPRVGVGGAEGRPRRIAEAEAALASSRTFDRSLPRRRRDRGRCGRSARGYPGGRRVPARSRARGGAPRAGARCRMTAEATGKWVGRAIRRLEDPALVTGQGRFTAILPPPAGCGSCAARSRPADITAITPPADATVITAADLKGVKPIPPMLHKFNYRPVGQPILADGVVRFVGEPIAAVVAASNAEAEDLADRVEVTIDETTPLVDARAALADGAPLVHAEAAGNVIVIGQIKTPEFDAALSRAHRRVRVDGALAAPERDADGSARRPRRLRRRLRPRHAHLLDPDAAL